MSQIETGVTALPEGEAVTRRLAVTVAAVFAVAVWGGTTVFTKAAVGVFDPMLLAVLRSVVAGAASLPLLLSGRLARPRGRQGWGLLLVSALGGFVVLPIAYCYGQRLTSASHGALILASMPIQTGLLMAAVERRWPAGRWWLGCAIALGGEVLLIGSRLGLDDRGSIWGDLLIFLAATGSASGYVSGSRLARKIGTGATTFWGNALGGLIMLPLLLIFGIGADWTAATPIVWLAVLYLGIVSSLIGYLAWYWALAQGGVARVSVIQFAQPLFAMALAMLWLSEWPTPPVILATAIILAGLYLTRRRRGSEGA
jgi:drug/metabolite transporter (DMT)-like permease